jgi:hypothetical protein
MEVAVGWRLNWLLGVAIAVIWAGQAAEASELCSENTPSLACARGQPGAQAPKNLFHLSAANALEAPAADHRVGATRLAAASPVQEHSDSGQEVPFSRWDLWAAGMRTRFDGRIPSYAYRAAAESNLAAPGQWDVRAFVVEGPRFGASRPGLSPYSGKLYGFGSTNEAAVLGRYPLTDSINFEMAAGRALFSSNAWRGAGEAAGPSLTMRPGYEVGRALWSLSLSSTSALGPVGITGRVGYLSGREYYDAQSLGGEGGVRIGGERVQVLRQSFVGVDASYGFARSWQLHGGAAMRRDLTSAESRFGVGWSGPSGAYAMPDRDEREWMVGVRYYGWRNFALNVEYLRTSGRDLFGGETLTLTGRFGF